MCEAMDAELLLGYLKWIRLDSAGSIRLMEGFNSQFGYKIIWIRKNIFHRHLLNRLTNGRGKLLHEVPVKTPGDFPFIKVWIGEIYVHHQTRFPSSAKIAKTELKPTHLSHVRNFIPLKTTYIGHVKWNNWRKRNVTESFELHAGLKRRSSLEGRKWADHKICVCVHLW